MTLIFVSFCALGNIKKAGGEQATQQFNMQLWHKLPRENILSATDVKVEYGEILDSGLDRGTYKTISEI